MTIRKSLVPIVLRMIEARALAIRDVDNGEEPFIYSSGNKGPGYLMIKGLVSQREILFDLVKALVPNIVAAFPDIEYVAGNATGGMVPAFVLALALQEHLKRDIPYFYVRNTRKIGGHEEYITGDKQNAFFRPGRRGLVFEELVNYAETTANSAIVQREAGYAVEHAATFVTYDHAKSRRLLTKNGLTLTHLLTVEEILSIAEQEGVFEKRLVDDYRRFLADPTAWQASRGFARPKGEN